MEEFDHDLSDDAIELFHKSPLMGEKIVVERPQKGMHRESVRYRSKTPDRTPRRRENQYIIENMYNMYINKPVCTPARAPGIARK